MRILILLLFTNTALADCYVYGGLFAYDDNQTKQDYSGLSPNGFYGVKCRHFIDDRLYIEGGYEHESSTGYRENGKGFNGPFFEVGVRLF